MKYLFLLLIAGVLSAVPPAQASGELLASSLSTVQAPFEADDEDSRYDREPIQFEDAENLSLKPIVENGYLDEQGRLIVDVYQEDFADLMVEVVTEDGRFVEAAPLTVTIEGGSELYVPPEPETNQYGIFEFSLIGGEMGLDTVTVSLGDSEIDILVNVISLEAFTMPLPEVPEGGIPWDDLLQADVRFEDLTLLSTFPETVSSRAGETIKISGFMMPLQTTTKQQWFLLTSNPPHCFFHIPGGAAGAIEVFAEEGIDVSWEPVTIEGRFEPLAESESAVYQLHDARLVKP